LLTDDWALLSLLLLLPLAVRTCISAKGTGAANAAALFGGLVLALMFREGVSWLARNPERVSFLWGPIRWICNLIRRILQFLGSAVVQVTGWLGLRRIVLVVAELLRRIAAGIGAGLRVAFALIIDAYAGLGPVIEKVHYRAFIYFLITLVVYVRFGLVEWRHIVAKDSWFPEIHSIAMVWALLMVLVWGMSWLSFIFDRDRIPVVGLLAFVLIAGHITPGTHTFPTFPWSGPKSIQSSTDALEKRVARMSSRPKWPMVAIAASGGGISASVWTARVIRGLNEAFEDVNFNDQVAICERCFGRRGGKPLLSRRVSEHRAARPGGPRPHCILGGKVEFVRGNLGSDLPGFCRHDLFG
jgi:hypothetical protein